MSECERINHSIVMQRYRSANRAIAFFSGFDSADVRLAIANQSQFPAMPSYQSIQSNAIAAILAQRLLQLACKKAPSY